MKLGQASRPEGASTRRFPQEKSVCGNDIVWLRAHRGGVAGIQDLGFTTRSMSRCLPQASSELSEGFI